MMSAFCFRGCAGGTDSDELGRRPRSKRKTSRCQPTGSASTPPPVAASGQSPSSTRSPAHARLVHLGESAALPQSELLHTEQVAVCLQPHGNLGADPTRGTAGQQPPLASTSMPPLFQSSSDCTVTIPASALFVPASRGTSSTSTRPHFPDSRRTVLDRPLTRSVHDSIVPEAAPAAPRDHASAGRIDEHPREERERQRSPSLLRQSASSALTADRLSTYDAQCKVALWLAETPAAVDGPMMSAEHAEAAPPPEESRPAAAMVDLSQHCHAPLASTDLQQPQWRAAGAPQADGQTAPSKAQADKDDVQLALGSLLPDDTGVKWQPPEQHNNQEHGS